MTLALFESDVIVFDLHSAHYKRIESAAKLLKAQELQSDKVFIVISSVMVWGATKPRAAVAEEDQEQQAEDEEDAPPNPLKGLQSYGDQDFNLRKAVGRFQHWKSLETLLISIGMSRPSLKLYVMAAGLMYGLGEQILNYHFQSAWLEDPAKLPYVGQGDNVVPTIHIIDLARACKFVAQNTPQQRYIVTVDCTEMPTQKNIVASIAKGIGAGEVVSLDDTDLDWAEYLSVNAYLKTSQVLLELPKAENEEEDQEEEEEDAKEKVPFEWHCKLGIAGNIAKLNQEFVEARGLVPVKVLVSGPPASGKTYFAKKLASFYNVPVIKVADVVKELKLSQTDLGNRVRDRLQELLDELQEAAEEDVVINPETIRVPDDLLAEAFRERLKANQCRNRGFVLDSWPRNYNDAKILFKPKLTVTDAEDNEIEKEDLLVEIVPQSMILLEAPDDFLTNRVKSLTEAQLVGTHFNDIDMPRRLEKYRTDNYSERGLPSLEDFMTSQGVESFSLSCQEGTHQFQLESMKIFIERNGKPINYMVYEQQAELDRKIRHDADEKKRLAKLQFELELEEAIEHEKKGKNMQAVKIRQDELWKKNRELLEQRAQPTRSYIAEEVLPVLTDGLLEACRKLPEDPIVFLAEYLFANAHRVRKPNPSSL